MPISMHAGFIHLAMNIFAQLVSMGLGRRCLDCSSLGFRIDLGAGSIDFAMDVITTIIFGEFDMCRYRCVNMNMSV